MIPVDQTTFGHGTGNCFTACVASVLELPIDEVPFFMAHENWGEALIDWCDAHQIDVVFSTVFPAPFGRVVIIGGRSPRTEGGHAVLARDGQVVHDPHPDRTGIVGEPWDWILLTHRRANGGGS